MYFDNDNEDVKQTIWSFVCLITRVGLFLAHVYCKRWTCSPVYCVLDMMPACEAQNEQLEDGLLTD